MLKAERHAYIMKYMKREGRIVIEDLAKEIDVSPMTIRRDLDYLEKNNKVIRTHGGAIPVQSLHEEIPYNNKKEKQIDEKNRIAKEARGLIKEGQTIILDAGTTTMEIAKQIVDLKDIIVVTTDLMTAVYLSRYKDIQVYCTGGIIQSEIGACIGCKAEDFLSGIYADIAFIGASFIDLDRGITSPTMEKAMIKKKMLEAGEKTILVADSTKFGKKGFTKVCLLEDLDLVITDKDIDEELLEKIKEKDININIV
ncbi:DeoR/GlpR transcriptional regulator [Clostridium sp. D2Q-14]|uniref:DeoR/GlpR family DNA-binding transcription regulator n=1 Tax=Anaeromonas gelatinilytica TaxID=2683194 RepID=UPI00193B7B38|nr:DeoR/GlpR family DNA-binding transcription regulator [Anaeromonas gelatinilytica]MBS4535649.1 DeoR/GlpR transcriptional regulator [Anaeromonas gelatinilytica]